MKTAEFVINLVSGYNAIIRLEASRLNLTLSQALHLLSIPFDGIAISKLAQKLGLDTSTLTRNIQKLEKFSLVFRKPDDYDRRMQIIFLTDEGYETHNQLLENINNLNYDIMSQLSIDDNEIVQQSIEKLAWALELQKGN